MHICRIWCGADRAQAAVRKVLLRLHIILTYSNDYIDKFRKIGDNSSEGIS